MSTTGRVPTYVAAADTRFGSVLDGTEPEEVLDKLRLEITRWQVQQHGSAFDQFHSTLALDLAPNSNSQ